MRKLIILLFVALILSACSGKDLSEGDAKACELYESTVEATSNNEITDDEMLVEIEDAWFVAESERLQDLLNELLVYFEEGEGDLQGTVNGIKTWCSLE